VIGFELQRPGLAWLLLVAPLALLIGWRALARSRAELARWVAERQRARFLPGVTGARAHLRVALGAAGLFFLALAALGPVRGHTWRTVSRKGLDLVLCLDTSRSMLAQDLRPSRLERAKREIRGLLDHLQGDRVALIAFSGDARDVAPLTRDRGTLEGLLAFVSPEDNQEGGTNLAAAIEHALALFDGRTGAHEAIVLLTDGEDLAGEAAAQAEEAAKRGIRLFVVGVGTEAGGKIPVVGPDGAAAFLRDENGEEVVSKLGRGSLAALAAHTGGEFLSAEEAPTALEDLYRARISRIQGREVEGGERRVPYDRFQWPLALGLACLVLELGLRGRGKRTERDGAGLRLAAACLPLALLPAQLPAHDGFSPSRALAEAVRRHEAGEEEEAAQAAHAILAHADALALGETERARAHFALGVIAATRALAKPAPEPAEAEAMRTAASEAFSAARALAGPGELRNDATYDLGVLELLHAEEVRAKIPEISGQPAAPPMAAPPGVPGATTPGAPPVPPPDPLPEARKLYESARGWLVERLRLEWRDEDTRANLELVQRRLRELDEIEKKREQEKKDQDKDQKQDGDQSKDDEKDKDEKDEEQDKKDAEKKDGKDGEKKDPKEGEEPEDEPPPDPKDGEGDKEKKEEPKPSEKEPPPKDGEAPEPKPGQPKEAPDERVLTREQVMQLLDKLSDLEKQQKALEAALRARKRAAAKRDW
jgi:Ca-activated chloride channel homolog